MANVADSIGDINYFTKNEWNENIQMIEKWKTLNKTCLENIDLSQVILIRKYEYCRQLFIQQSQFDDFRNKNSNRIIYDWNGERFASPSFTTVGY